VDGSSTTCHQRRSRSHLPDSHHGSAALGLPAAPLPTLSVQYLNDIVEQHQGVVKKRILAKQGLAPACLTETQCPKCYASIYAKKTPLKRRLIKDAKTG
jgi:hypothetical protein